MHWLSVDGIAHRRLDFNIRKMDYIEFEVGKVETLT